MLETEIARKLENMRSLRDLRVSISRSKRIAVRVGKEHLKELIRFLKTEGFAHLLSITAVEEDDAFELLYHLGNEGVLLTVQIRLPLDEATAPTIIDIIPGALPYEMEIHDLFGVKFEGNPNIASFILPDDWPKDVYPMRKSEKVNAAKNT